MFDPTEKQSSSVAAKNAKSNMLVVVVIISNFLNVNYKYTVFGKNLFFVILYYKGTKHFNTSQVKLQLFFLFFFLD